MEAAEKSFGPLRRNFLFGLVAKRIVNKQRGWPRKCSTCSAGTVVDCTDSASRKAGAVPSVDSACRTADLASPFGDSAYRTVN
jgi:hypothetical protein